MQSNWRELSLVVLALVAFLGIAYAVLEVAPDQFAEKGKLTDAERAEARQGVRTASLALLAGAIGVLGAFYTARTFALNRKGQITERFTRAVDQLAAEDLALRLGGIYALERIADESAKEYRPIVWILAAYVRENSPWPPANPTLAGREDAPPEAAEDIKAIIAVLRRRNVGRHERGDPIPIGLAHTNLRGSRPRTIRLIGTDLGGAQLQDTNLRGAHLRNANLREANLRRATLIGADLRGATLVGARYDDETKWPKDFDPEAAGATRIEGGRES